MTCGMNCMADADPVACVSACLQVETGITGGCADCFGAFFQCVIGHCISQCMAGRSEACLECETDSGCRGALDTCAGFDGG